jgi:tetratricopeptide (TPR) repeat protein
MNRYFLILLLVFTQITVFGQNIDSLEMQLNTLHDKEKIDVLNRLSQEYCSAGNMKASKHFADEALYLATELNYTFGMAEALKNIAEYFYELKIFDNSAEYYLKANEKYRILKDKENMSYCNNVAGICYRKLFAYDKSIEYHLISLRIAEEIENENRISAAVYSLGVLYHSMNNYEKALEYYDRSLKFDIKNNDSLGIAKSYTNIGIIYKHLNNIKKAEEYYNRALDLYKELNDTEGMAIIVNNLGFLYKDNKHYNKAIEYFNKSIFYEKISDNNEGIASSLNSIGDTYLAVNKLDSALKYQTLALELTNDLDIKKYIYESLSKIYSQKKDYKKALTYHELFVSVKDTIYKLENLKQIADMQTKYDTEKKEKEISELITRKKIQELSLKKNKIIIYVSLGGLILLFILIIVVLSAYRIKQKANKKLSYQNTQILRQKEEIIAQRDEIEIQKQDIETKHKQITASINYAKLIQEAVLPKKSFVDSLLPDYFILYKPKDVVSGDFYFIKHIKDYTLIAAADCTGHGVPGAFMSMLGIAILNEIIRNSEIQNSADLLNELRDQVKLSLNQTGEKGEQQDGMDIAFCALNQDTLELSFAGANNPLYLIRKNELFIFEADGMPISIYLREKPFKNQTIKLEKNDRLYIFSDGYISQFDHKYKDTYKTKRFKELLLNIHQKSMSEQKVILEKEINNWKGNTGQTDDILIIGIKI